MLPRIELGAFRGNRLGRLLQGLEATDKDAPILETNLGRPQSTRLVPIDSANSALVVRSKALGADILRVCGCAKMVRVDAELVPAQVVDEQSVTDRPAMDCVAISVGQPLNSADTARAISGIHGSTNPYPTTSGSLRDVRPEPAFSYAGGIRQLPEWLATIELPDVPNAVSGCLLGTVAAGEFAGARFSIGLSIFLQRGQLAASALLKVVSVAQRTLIEALPITVGPNAISVHQTIIPDYPARSR